MRDHSLRHAGTLSASGDVAGEHVEPAPTDSSAFAEAARRLLAADVRTPIAREAGETLLTDGAAIVLGLERARLAAKRRRRAALVDAAILPGAAREAAHLAGEEQRAEQQIDELRELLAAVRRRLSLRAVG